MRKTLLTFAALISASAATAQVIVTVHDAASGSYPVLAGPKYPAAAHTR